MNNVNWHKVSEHDYPQPFRKVLIISDTDDFYIAWYEGETRKLPWYFAHASYYVSSKHVKVWCELPNIPFAFMERETK